MLIDSRTGLAYPDPHAEHLFGELREYRMLEFPPAAVCLDIGGCIGTFVWLALEKGARKVVCYEPDPDNWEYLQYNFEQNSSVELHRRAVTATNGYFELWKGGSISTSTLIPVRGRQPVEVVSDSFRCALSCRPQVVKIDIEGGEYSLPMEQLPDSVVSLAMELHLKRRSWRSNEAPQMLAKLERLGFYPLKAPKIGAKNWTTTGIWKR